MMKGYDAATNCSAIAGKLAANGAGFLARYYGGSWKKDLTAAEAKTLCEAGLRIVTVYEALGDRYTSFTAPSGQRDAQEAMRQARGAWQPEGSAIYFAVDFDANEGQFEHGIMPYFQAVGAVLRGHYAVGVYGSGSVLAGLSAAGLAQYLWLAQSRDWRGTYGFASAHIVQGPGEIIFDVSVDPDTTASDEFGSWKLGEVPAIVGGPASLPTAPARKEAITNAAKELQRQLQLATLYNGEIDGIIGRQTIAALQRFNAG